eukprot:Em0015g464a
MVLADFGASVVRIDRPNHPSFDALGRGKRSIAVNLRHSLGKEIALEACRNADVLLEPFRPGVMERLGLGPDVLLRSNPRLVYARLTGFGQYGCLSHRAGHDINYVAISGILSLLGRKNENPNPPVNLVSATFDPCMLYHRRKCFAERNPGVIEGLRGTNILDGGAPFYEVCGIAGGFGSKWSTPPWTDGSGTLGSISLLPQMKERFAAVFRTKTRDEWTKIFSSKERQVFASETEANPAPKLQRTPAQPETNCLPEIGEHTVEVLKELKYTPERIEELLKTGTVAQHQIGSKL